MSEYACYFPIALERRAGKKSRIRAHSLPVSGEGFMSGLTVLHLLEAFVVGGAEKVTLDLCRGLAEKGIGSVAVAVREGELRDSFNAVVPTLLATKKRGPDPRLPFSLAALIRATGADVVHLVNGLTVVNYGVVAARLARAPSVVSVHGLSHFGERGLGARVWRRMLSYADQRVAVSADIQSKVRACSRSSNLTELIYNSIEAPSSLSENPRDELFAQWDISANAFVVTCVANLREVKGHRYLLQAVALLGQRMPRLKLLLIGTGELHKELEQLARELGVRDRVIFAGRRHDVPNCLAASDLFVLPSLSEGTPLCILEAMRAGLPVVATAVGGIPEIVETGRSAFLVPPGNPQALAEAILAASESAVAASLGACGKQLFHDRFRREIFIDRYAELFVKTAARKKGI